MKKLFLPLLVLTLLSACGKTHTDTIKPDLSFDSAFSVSYMQSVYSANIKNDGNGNLTAVINGPDNLKGITFRCSPDGMRVRCGELEIDGTDGYYPFTDLYKVLEYALSNAPVSYSEKGSETELVYINGKEKFFVTVNTETGTINRIQTPMGEYIRR